MVRRLNSCGFGFFLGHAFGDEGAVGRGMLVIGWEGGRYGEMGRTWKEYALVLKLLLLLVFYPAAFERVEVATTLETNGCDQSLNLGPAKQS